MTKVKDRRPTLQFDDETFELLMDCIHCGFCLTVCPTFALTGDETDSPRGRLYYMRLLAEGRIEPEESVLNHLDRCLTCRACETACPSGVRYGFLAELTRAQLTKRGKGPTRKAKFHEILLRYILPYPKRLEFALLPLRIAQMLKLTEWFNGIPFFARAINMIPPLPSRRWRKMPEVFPAKNGRKLRVGLATGCVNSIVLSRTNWSTAEVLSASGCEVIIPKSQGCCGAISLHTGHLEEAKKFARQLVLTFARYEPLDAIVLTAAGCETTMKEYGHLLADDPEVAELARNFASKVKDFCELLDEIGLPSPLKPMPMKVTYHDPCHLAHGQNVRQQPRNLIRQVPEVEFVELPESDWCCGGAGAYSLLQPEMSEMVLERKIANIKSTGAEAVITSNIVCMMQLWYGIQKHKLNVRLITIADFLRAALPEV
ncbi:MAG: heterodisulfide reductase-related iron-sulfur binding cluster [Armatimonadota bacterium]|nr:heterodisulfide reductase-related iron-sulfur binding cluster [Armatimonadota bacterium]